mmetsp:Transcript_19523/g.42350  ORF Transcript_19523/g.42350 Transcript_19523/m.42350 type:complete len:297 (-) Transcript_19523:2364-3254(-)
MLAGPAEGGHQLSSTSPLGSVLQTLEHLGHKHVQAVLLYRHGDGRHCLPGRLLLGGACRPRRHCQQRRHRGPYVVVQGGACHCGQRPQGTHVVDEQGLLEQLGHRKVEDLGAYTQDDAEALQGLGKLIVRFQACNHGRHDAVHRAAAAAAPLEQDGEGLPSRLAHCGVGVTQRGLHSGQHVGQVLRQLVAVDVLQNLLETKAHALPCRCVLRADPGPQYGNDAAQHPLSHLPAQLTEAAGGHGALVLTLTGQRGDELLHQHGQHLPQCLGRVDHNGLPHVQRLCAYGVLGVGPDDV